MNCWWSILNDFSLCSNLCFPIDNPASLRSGHFAQLSQLTPLTRQQQQLVAGIWLRRFCLFDWCIFFFPSNLAIIIVNQSVCGVQASGGVVSPEGKNNSSRSVTTLPWAASFHFNQSSASFRLELFSSNVCLGIADYCICLLVTPFPPVPVKTRSLDQYCLTRRRWGCRFKLATSRWNEVSGRIDEFLGLMCHGGCH